MIGWLTLAALAATPGWMTELAGRLEVCSVAELGELPERPPPPLTPIQEFRRTRRTGSMDIGWEAPYQRTLMEADPVALSVEVAPHPVLAGWSLARVELRVAPVKTGLPQHLTIAVDTSESMYSSGLTGLPVLHDEPPPERGAYASVSRLALVREALHDLVERLERPDVTIAIVAARRDRATALLPPTPATDKAALHAAIDRIDAKNVGEGELFETLYRTASQAFEACGDDRIVVLSDDNVRIQGDPAEVLAGVRDLARRGFRLHGVAVGTKADLTPNARLISAGGGSLLRADTVAELDEALTAALRTVGSVVMQPEVSVTFPKQWRRAEAGGQGPIPDRWALPEPLPSDYTQVHVYAFAGDAVTATVTATPVLEDAPRTWTATVRQARAWESASAAFRHSAAFALVDLARRDTSSREAVREALHAGVREVGLGREAQALLEALGR